MTQRLLIAVVLFVTALNALAQAASSAASKKALAMRAVQLQQANIETMARTLVGQPAATMMEQADVFIQNNVAPDKRAELQKAIEADVKKYADEVMPLVLARAKELGPGVIEATYEERFSEDELRLIVSWLESSAYRKYQQAAPEMQKALTGKLLTATRSVVEPKLEVLRAAISNRLSTPDGAQSSPGRKAVPPMPKGSEAIK